MAELQYELFAELDFAGNAHHLYHHAKTASIKRSLR